MDIVSEPRCRSNKAPVSETESPSSCAASFMSRFPRKISKVIGSLKVSFIMFVFSSSAADTRTGFVVSRIILIGLPDDSAISFPRMSDTAPADMSSCGVRISRIVFIWSMVRFKDIASEYGAAESIAAPARETWPLSLTRIRDRSAEETSIVSSNATVIRPVFWSSAADAREGFASSAAASLAICRPLLPDDATIA